MAYYYMTENGIDDAGRDGESEGASWKTLAYSLTRMDTFDVLYIKKKGDESAYTMTAGDQGTSTIDFSFATDTPNMKFEGYKDVIGDNEVVTFNVDGMSANAYMMNMQNCLKVIFVNLRIHCSDNTRSGVDYERIVAGYCNTLFWNCEFDTLKNGFNINSVTYAAQFVNCKWNSCSRIMLTYDSPSTTTANTLSFQGCHFVDNTDGIDADITYLDVIDCVFENTAEIALFCGGFSLTGVIANNLFNGGKTAIELEDVWGAIGSLENLTIMNNVFTNTTVANVDMPAWYYIYHLMKGNVHHKTSGAYIVKVGAGSFDPPPGNEIADPEVQADNTFLKNSPVWDAGYPIRPYGDSSTRIAGPYQDLDCEIPTTPTASTSVTNTTIVVTITADAGDTTTVYYARTAVGTFSSGGTIVGSGDITITDLSPHTAYTLLAHATDGDTYSNIEFIGRVSTGCTTGDATNIVTAIDKLLRDNKALPVAWYQQVPVNSPKPYIWWQIVASSPDDDMSERVDVYTIEFNLWDVNPTPTDIEDYRTELEDAMNMVWLPMDGWTVISSRKMGHTTSYVNDITSWTVRLIYEIQLQSDDSWRTDI